MGLIVGIDFGTSTTVVRYKVEGTDVIKVVKDANGSSDIIPSLIFRVSDQNQTLYGNEALGAVAGGMKGELISNFKMGLLEIDKEKNKKNKLLIEEFLTFIHNLFRNQIQGVWYNQLEVYFSVPAKWDSNARTFMESALKNAGFGNNINCVDEPTAAAFTMLHHHLDGFQKSKMLTAQNSMHVFMLDMGAGTTDIVIFQLKIAPNGRIEVDNKLSYPTINNPSFCGGREIDKALSDHILSSVAKSTGSNIEDLKSNDFFTLYSAKYWKDQYLSNQLKNNVACPIPPSIQNTLIFMGEGGMLLRQSFIFNRQIFENETKSHWDQLYKLIESAIGKYHNDYGIGAKDIDLLFLTGGHSQWYCVPNLFNSEGINGYIGKDINNGQGIVRALNFEKLRNDPWRMFGDALRHECVATGLCLQDSNIKFPATAANNVWAKLSVNEVSSEYIQILKVGDILPVRSEQSLEVTISRNLVFGNQNFNVIIEICTGNSIDDAKRKVLKLKQDERSVLGQFIVGLMLVFIFCSVDYKFKVNLCIDALENGTIDLNGDLIVNDCQDKKKELSIKDMEEI